MTKRPVTGFGVGLRPCHYSDFFETHSAIDFVEINSENFLLEGGRALSILNEVAEVKPVIPHGVSLSIGSSDGIDWEYLKRLKKMVDRLDPPWFSDHLCWSRHAGHYMHNLLPIPYTPDVARFIADKIRTIQEFMDRPFIIENVSSYIAYTESTMTEWEFLSDVVEWADCGILLDINNVFVSANNHGFDPMHYLNGLPAHRVKQHHIAGHTVKDSFILDTHDAPVADPVWDLYAKSIPIFGHVPLILERDDDFPTWSELINELAIARTLFDTHAPTQISL